MTEAFELHESLTVPRYSGSLNVPTQSSLRTDCGLWTTDLDEPEPPEPAEPTPVSSAGYPAAQAIPPKAISLTAILNKKDQRVTRHTIAFPGPLLNRIESKVCSLALLAFGISGVSWRYIVLTSGFFFV